MKRLAILLALFLTLTVTVSAGTVFLPLVQSSKTLTSATITSIVDGDTVWVDLDGNETPDQKVRYILVNTPERGECYYAQATERNRQLVAGQVVGLEKDRSETDRYGRLLRYVYADTVWVNGVLVREGYARVAVYPPDRRYETVLRGFEDQARAEGLGGWGECGW